MLMKFVSEGRIKALAERGWAGIKYMGDQGGWVKPRPLLINIVVVIESWAAACRRARRRALLRGQE